MTFASALTGSGGLTKAGSGTLSLTASNTFSGATNVTAGTLNVGGAGALFNTTVNVTNNNSLAFSVPAATLGGLSGSGNVNLNNALLTVGNNGASTLYSGSLLGGNGLTKVGGGVLTLTNSSSYGGPTVISGGVLKLGPSLPQIAGMWEGLVSATSGTDTTDAIPHTSIQLSARWGTSTTSGGNNVYPAWGNNTTWGYTGYFYVPTAGIYTFGKNFDDNGYLKIDGTSIISDTTYNDAYTNTDALTAGWHTIDLRFGQDGGNVGPNGATQLGGFGIAFEAPGSSTWTQFADPGNGTVLAVQLASTYSNSLPITTPVSVASGATFDLGGGSQQVASLSDAIPGLGGTIQNSAAYNPSVLTLSNTAGSSTFSGVIAGGGTLGSLSLVMAGSGLQVLAGSNTYTGGTTINGGTLQMGLGAGAALGSGTANLAVNAGLLDLNGNSLFVNALSGSGSGTIDNVTAGGALTLTLGNGGGIFTGTIRNTSGTLALVMAGQGIQVLAGTNTYTGGTTISAGTLQFGTGTTNGSVLGTIVDNAALSFNNGSPQTYSGVISGSGRLTEARPQHARPGGFQHLPWLDGDLRRHAANRRRRFASRRQPDCR